MIMIAVLQLYYYVNTFFSDVLRLYTQKNHLRFSRHLPRNAFIISSSPLPNLKHFTNYLKGNFMAASGGRGRAGWQEKNKIYSRT